MYHHPTCRRNRRRQREGMSWPVFFRFVPRLFSEFLCNVTRLQGSIQPKPLYGRSATPRIEPDNDFGIAASLQYRGLRGIGRSVHENFTVSAVEDHHLRVSKHVPSLLLLFRVRVDEGLPLDDLAQASDSLTIKLNLPPLHNTLESSVLSQCRKFA